MTPADWRALAVQHLDKLDDIELEQWATEQPTADLFAELLRRLDLARQAFPGMTWEEFSAVDAARHRSSKKGRPARSAEARANQEIWLAARDADRIKQLWRALHPGTPCPRPPVHPHDIAAGRHEIPRQLVDDAVKRPDSRRIDRLAAQK